MKEEQDRIVIPISKLQKGFDECTSQIKNLVDSSEILFNERKYSTSIGLSILAFEETSKLELIAEKLSSKNPILKKEWDKLNGLGTHGDKLGRSQKKFLDIIHKISDEDFEKMKELDKIFKMNRWTEIENVSKDDFHTSDEILENFKILNEIKQDCLYVDWKEFGWYAFSKNSKKIQKDFAWRRLIEAKYSLYALIQGNYYHKTIFKKSRTKKSLDDLNYHRIEFLKIQKITQTPKFLEAEKRSNHVVFQYVQYKKEKNQSRSYLKNIWKEDSLPDLPDIFYLMLGGTGLGPHSLLQLKKEDINLDDNSIKSKYPGCEVCRIHYPSSKEDWDKHIKTIDHLYNTRISLKAYFQLKDGEEFLTHFDSVMLQSPYKKLYSKMLKNRKKFQEGGSEMEKYLKRQEN